MPTTTPTLAPERRAARVRSGVFPGRRRSLPMLSFDDSAAVMYRKIDTTPLSATFPRSIGGITPAADLLVGSTGSFVDYEIGCVVSSFIFSRMTLRPVFAPAGAFPERMTP